MLPLTKADLVAEHSSCVDIDQRFRFVRRLGAGSFGTVDLLSHRRTGADRVCKTVNVKGMKLATLALMKKEIMLLQELDHPRIVKLYEQSEDTQRGMFLLVMEHLPGGDLGTLIKDGSTPEEGLVARLMEQVLSATAYCHARGIVHCDLKLDNVMLTGPLPKGWARWCGEPVECKVIDFGLAAHFVQSDPDSITQVAGTPAFIAPEVISALRGGSFGPKVDVWSIGVMAYNLLSGELPFGHHQDYGGDFWMVFNRIEAFQGIDFEREEWKSRSDSACEFVDDLMQVDPRSRPSARDALHLPFFEEHLAVQHKKIRRRVLRSLRDFARSPDLVKVCLLFIASRVEGKRLKSCRRAFAKLDVDASGALSREELEIAVANPGGCFPCCLYPQVEVDEIFDEVNLSQSGEIQYTEFAAACLFSELGSRSGKELVSQAFSALDEDGDGLITADAVLAFFAHKGGPVELPMLASLPQGRAFDEEEFYKCLRRSSGSNRHGIPVLCSSLFCGTSDEFQEYYSDCSSNSD